MSTTPHQPERDDDDLLVAAEAEAQERPARVEEPEDLHPRIPASVSRRLQDRSAGVEFDPKAVRSTRPEVPSRPTALAGGLPSGRRPVSGDAAPAPWGRLAAHDQHDAVPALSLGAPAPKPISAEDVDPGQGAPDDSVAEAGADGTGRGTFTTVRIVLGVLLLLLVIALVLLLLL